MAKARTIKFPGNPRPAVRHGERCVIVVIPVVRIERWDGSLTPEERAFLLASDKRKPRRRRRRP